MVSDYFPVLHLAVNLKLVSRPGVRILASYFINAKKEETMAKSEQNDANANLTPPQQTLGQLWEDHVRYEFSTRNTEDTLATMVDDAYVNHIPVLTGGVGKDELREFYSKRFIPQMPPDTEMIPVSRTIGNDQLVDEMVFKFTHTIRMDWMLPGVAPTGKRVEVPLAAIVRFREGKLAHEHIYWDQASVLVQIGLIDAAKLPVAGVKSARKVLDPKLPANELMKRAEPIE
jgi:carboxymethylenebutenolidase